ncbi:MAG: DUF2815 family protein [Oscillospiraceae bacterium]|nr:DUF2815 family protein [Oscillospiraceae bacterium]
MALSNTQMTTGEVRLSYAHLYDPYSNNGGEPKYSVTVLMPKTDVQAKARLDAAFEAAKQKGIAEKWNGVLPPVVASAIHDGDGVRPNGEPFGAECKGHWVFTASSKNPVSLVDASMNPIVQKGELYSGCYARVCVSLFPYNSNGKRGIGIGLEAVQKLRDGDPLGGGVSVADAFGGTPMAQPTAPAQQYQQNAAPMQQYQQPAQAQPGMWYPGGGQPYQAPVVAPAAFDPITGQPL